MSRGVRRPRCEAHLCSLGLDSSKMAAVAVYSKPLADGLASVFAQ